MKKSTFWVCIVFSVICLFSSSAMASTILVKQGMEGERVGEVQLLLKEKGYYTAEITKICDEATVEAIKKFQKEHQLEVDGICGSLTYRKLNPPNISEDLKNARIMTVTATAYSPQDPGMGLYTASGTPLRRGVIAVDPNVIPMGTIVYIPDYGEAVAEDIGWGVRGNMIDIAFDTHEEAIIFGRQVVEIYILQ